jgi:hypothetical protein
MEGIGLLIEKYESNHVPELAADRVRFEDSPNSGGKE